MLPSLTTLAPFREDVTLEYAASLVRRGQISCQGHRPFPCSKQFNSFVPTRLVSISQEDGPLRLVESVATTAPYATLSYCWGESRPPSTTTANLSARLHCIPDHSLPVVFHQAIQLARALEIPYIWIDSLCIIQDSIEDWEVESARMSLYYNNGSINIAAATSDNPDIPFFKHIDDTWCLSRVTVHDLQGTPSLINIKRLPTFSNTKRDIRALFTRGWTFQESLFAPRTIYFTSQGVFWKCSTLRSLSDNYAERIIEHMLRPISLQFSFAPNDGIIIGGGQRVQDWVEDWRLLVEDYSDRLLTFPTDKLAAISGAAAQFYEYLDCPYLAGHWYKDLPQSLIWSENILGHSHNWGPLPTEYIAPSWSWASLTSGILNYWSPEYTVVDRMISPAAKLVDVHCEVPGRNPYGSVSSGFIELRGVTAPINIRAEGEGDYFTTRNDWDFSADCALRMSGISLTRAIAGEAISNFAASACCLYLASLTKPDDSTMLVTHYALVLGMPDRQQLKTSFVRVGLLKSTSESAMELFDGAVEKTVRIL